MLTKSLYVKALQCEKALWLKKYKPEVLAQPSEATKAIFESGNKVGTLAHDLFPGGKEIPYEGVSREERVSLTQKYLDEGVETIYEATFIYDDMLVMVDLLHKNGDSWEIYEVKSSTKVDDVYLDDASAQYYVLDGLGMKVSKAFIVHINNQYVLGDTFDVHAYFTKSDQTEAVFERQDIVREKLKDFKKVLEQKEEYEKPIGHHCKNPYLCDAYEYCWRTLADIPEYSVFDIFNMTQKGGKGMELLCLGVKAVEDIPMDFKLTDTQQRKVDAWVYKSQSCDKEQIQAFLDKISYPVYHLDFETCNSAVPLYQGTRPYQQIPFQYSLHIEHEDGTLEHKEFLAPSDGKDSREALIHSLVNDIPAGACVTAYNDSFEKSRIKELRELSEEYRPLLDGIVQNVVDLMEPFQKQYYTHYSLKGKYSIKLVMPLLAPDMALAYKQLSLVQNGGDAMNTFPRLFDMEAEEQQRYRDALLAYCKLDTLSMVRVHQAIRML